MADSQDDGLARRFEGVTVDQLRAALKKVRASEPNIGFNLKGKKQELLEKVQQCGIESKDGLFALLGVQTSSASAESTASALPVSSNTGPEVTVYRSSSKDAWVEVDLPDLTIVLKDDATALAGKWVESIVKIHNRVKRLIETNRKNYSPNVPDDVLLLVELSKEYSQLVIERTNKRFPPDQRIDGTTLNYAISAAIAGGLVMLSSEKKWSIICGKECSDEYTFERHQSIMRNLSCLAIHDEGVLQSCGWGDPRGVGASLGAALEAVNTGIRQVADSVLVSIDDDVVRTVSVEVTKDRYAPMTHNPRKGDGVSMNVAADVFTGIPLGVHIASKKQHLLSDTCATLKLGAAHTICADRGYAGLGESQALLKSNMNSVMILNDHFTRQRGVDVVVSTTPGFEVPAPVKVKGVVRPQLLVFTGCGPSVKVVRHPSGVLGVSVVQTYGKKSKALHFVVTGSKFPASKMNQFALIPKSVARKKQDRLLTVAVERDARAREVVKMINETCEIMTEVQVDGAWFAMRKMMITGSMMNRFGRRVLNCYMAAYATVREYHCKTGVPAFNPLQASINSTSTTGDEVLVEEVFAEEDSAVVEDEFPEASEDDDSDEDSLSDESDDDEIDNSAGNGDDEIDDSAGNGDDEIDDNAGNGDDADEVTPSISEENISTISSTVMEQYVRYAFVTSFSGNDATWLGNKVESKAIRAVECFFDGNVTFDAGFIASKVVPWSGASPDAIGLMDGELVVVEVKTSESYPALPQAMPLSSAKIITVDAGSDEFFCRVPHEYLPQLLHEAAVLNTRKVLLVLANPGRISSLTIVRFSDALIEDYLLFLQCDVWKRMFEWYHNALSQSAPLSDADLVGKIPEEFSLLTRQVLATNLPFLRAVARFRKKLGRPLPPTRCFREAVTAIYNHSKGATDTECKQVAQLTMGLKETNTPFHQRFALRLFYFSVITAVRSYRAYCIFEQRFGKDVKKIRDGVAYATKGLADLGLRRFRALMNQTPLNDAVFDLMKQMRSSRISLGIASQSIVASPKAPVLDERVTGADAEHLRMHIRGRALRLGRRPFTSEDFVPGTRIPIDDNAMSVSTPGAPIFKDSYVRMATGSWEDTFLGRPVRPAQWLTRVSWWSNAGHRMRVSTMILHKSVQASEDDSKSRPDCIVCRGRPKKNLVICAFCGEWLCDDVCFRKFHHEEFPFEHKEKDSPPGEDTASSGVSTDVSVNADGRDEGPITPVPLHRSFGSGTATNSRSNPSKMSRKSKRTKQS